MKVNLTYTELEAENELISQFKGRSGMEVGHDVSVEIVRTGGNVSIADVLNATKIVSSRKTHSDRKIETIMEIRKLTGWGLADTKNFVELIWC